MSEFYKDPIINSVEVPYDASIVTMKAYIFNYSRSILQTTTIIAN